MFPGSMLKTASPAHRSRRTAGILLSLLVLNFSSPAPGAADCLVSRLPAPDGRPAAAISPGLDVEREDLLVTLRWSETPSYTDPTFVLTAPAAGDLGSWPALVIPGEQTAQRLPGALSQVGGAGFQYLLELRDGDAVVGWRAFRVAVDCAGGPCRYRLLPDLEGGPIAVSEAFWNVVDEARAGGSKDLLTTVRKNHPELAGEIPSFAWQLQQLEPPSPGDRSGRSGSGCSCRWVLAESLTAFSVIGPRQGTRPEHEYGVNMEGAAFFAGTQSTGFPAAEVERPQTTGTTLLGLELLCTTAEGGSTARYPTTWPSRPLLEVTEPVLIPCPAPCTPTIEHGAEVKGCAQGGVTSRQGLPVSARAEMDAGLSLNRQLMIDGVAVIDIQVTDDELIRDVEYLDKSSAAVLRSESAVVELDAGAFLKSTATQPDTGAPSYAFTAASMEYTVWLEAPEACGIPPAWAQVHSPLRGSDDGGVAMERWEQP